MKTILRHEDGSVSIEKLVSGKTRIHIELFDERLFMPCDVLETYSPIDLIEEMLDVTGPCWLCHGIRRDESDRLSNTLKYGSLRYINEALGGGPQKLDNVLSSESLQEEGR